MAFGIPNIERIVSNFLEGGTGITSIRNIEFSKNYLWTIDFTDFKPPKPFDTFFPASDVSIPISILVDDVVEFGQTNARFPIGTTAKELSITFYDDEQRTLLRWMKDWIDLDIQNYGQYVSGLLDNHKSVAPDMNGDRRDVQPIRAIKLGLLQAYRKEVISFNYSIFPTGEITFSGSQASEATTYTMQFVVVEDLAKKSQTKPGKYDDIKQILGRFI